uniref:hypothetical protein n=1 Tax=Catellatospora sichuanensis TaxID=1969805 RepID=UPI001C8FCA3E
VLNQLADRFTDEGVIIIDTDAAHAMRLPTTQHTLNTIPDDHNPRDGMGTMSRSPITSATQAS